MKQREFGDADSSLDGNDPQVGPAVEPIWSVDETLPHPATRSSSNSRSARGEPYREKYRNVFVIWVNEKILFQYTILIFLFCSYFSSHHTHEVSGLNLKLDGGILMEKFSFSKRRKREQKSSYEVRIRRVTSR